MSDLDLKRLAIHEAGHAVMQHQYGIEIEKITIIPFPGALGYSVGKLNDIKPNIEKLSPAEQGEETKYLIVSRIFLGFSGILAEHIYDGEPNEFKLSLFQGDSLAIEDFLKIARSIKGFEEKEGDFLRMIREDTIKLLKEKWPAVEALADALIQKKTIKGEEAIVIIERAIAGPCPFDKPGRREVESWQY